MTGAFTIQCSFIPGCQIPLGFSYTNFDEKKGVVHTHIMCSYIHIYNVIAYGPEILNIKGC